MNRLGWTVVTALAVPAGLLAALIKSIVKLTGTMSRNTFAIETLTETIKSNETRNEKEYVEIWDRLVEHNKKVSCIAKRRAD